MWSEVERGCLHHARGGVRLVHTVVPLVIFLKSNHALFFLFLFCRPLTCLKTRESVC